MLSNTRHRHHGIFSPAFFPLGIIRLFNWLVIGEKKNREQKSCGEGASGRMLLYDIKMRLQTIDNKRDSGGSGGRRTPVPKYYWARHYNLNSSHSPGLYPATPPHPLKK